MNSLIHEILPKRLHGGVSGSYLSVFFGGHVPISGIYRRCRPCFIGLGIFRAGPKRLAGGFRRGIERTGQRQRGEKQDDQRHRGLYRRRHDARAVSGRLGHPRRPRRGARSAQLFKAVGRKFTREEMNAR